MGIMIGKLELALAVVLLSLVGFSMYDDMQWRAEYQKICDTRGCY